MATATRTIPEPSGTSLICGGRSHGAALGMLMSNLDADIARRRDDPGTHPFASLGRDAGVFAAGERRGVPMAAAEARAR